eukprot:9608922-Lingulodinium_polyedra.AAC.1
MRRLSLAIRGAICDGRGHLNVPRYLKPLFPVFATHGSDLDAEFIFAGARVAFRPNAVQGP